MPMIESSGYLHDTDYDTIKLNKPKNVTVSISTELQDNNIYEFHQQNIEYTKVNNVTVSKLGCKWRDVFQISINIPFNFTPGDSLGLLCPNSQENTQRLLDLFKVHKDTQITYEKKGHDPFFYKGSIHDFFRYFFDIKTIPKKNFLYYLAQNCSNKNHLLYYCTKYGSNDYFNLYKNWTNLLEIIEFFGCKPELSEFLLYTSINKPRHFSYTNKPNEDASILLGVLENKAKDRIGHCSEFFKLKYYKTAHFYVTSKANKLIKPFPSKKMLIIATGLGIAPFLSFVKSLDSEFWLIYGCRDKEDDLSVGLDIRKSICLSSQNLRVTDYITDNLPAISDFVKEDCLVYVCGNLRMQGDVNNIFKKHFADLVDEKRIFSDNWL